MTQLPAPVQAAIDAANAGDIEQFLALFGPGGSVDDWGRTFTGPGEIRSWSDAEFIGAGLSARLTAVKATPERAWLGQVSAVVLQQAQADLNTAYRNFFASQGAEVREPSRVPRPISVPGRAGRQSEAAVRRCPEARGRPASAP
jgi:hypothetical protein